MNIRLFRTGRHTRKKKIVSLMTAVAMLAGALSVVLFTTGQTASAAVEDFRPANWNMQGAQNSQDNKWQSGVRSLINSGHDVIALQEAGQVPNTAGRWDSQNNQMLPGPAHDFGTWFTSLRNGQGWTVQRYDWRPGGSRLGVWNIYFMQTDFGANRVNLAIVTRNRADRVNVARPAFTNANGQATSRPALGVRFGDTYFWTVHTLSGGGNDAPRLLANIQSASSTYHWAAMGDFNRQPATLPSLGANVHIYNTGQPTHYGGNGNNNELDYMVSSDDIVSFVPGTTDLGSDHRAVFYYTLRANADVQFTMPSDHNSTFAGNTSEDNKVAAWDVDTDGWPDVSWHLSQVPGTGVYTIMNNDTGECMDAEDSVLRDKSCSGSSWQKFFLDNGGSGLLNLLPYNRLTCVGEGTHGQDRETFLSTTVSCSDSKGRLKIRFDHDPGADGVPLGVGHVQVQSTFTVAADGSAQFQTVQAAINAVPTDGNPHTILINRGTYHEVISVPKTQTNLTIKGATGNAEDVNITYGNAHGTLKPDGTEYGTEGSATASFKAPNLRVESLTITNSFDPAAHSEISPYETQAVALAATGDRQVYTNVRIIGRQDTVLAKSPAATDQTRQYFRNVYIAGSIDFLFGNATAVFDRANIDLAAWPGGTIVAPNTDQAKKYGILITNSNIVSKAAANTFYLGRPWHNTTTAQPQTVIRDSSLPAAITTTQPWTNMTTDYSWQSARFFEYHNLGTGAGVNSNRPQLTDAQAGDYTASKYLAGTDGWNPIW
ncbi:pectinesterase family protein [Streptomyces sp. 3214.6]|uniref:pectinesterase family protein n=1 Tax=Streptomyces sp. 3214.6 TaxID=1882757 RepID=UPI00090B3226|nr:pectinesterase family protein [Streptomyces sp. 3214.6]SHH31528.1 Pectin methylesterase [Streptomyces sp. 3214.6]